MADFCKQCSIEQFGKDYEELAGLFKDPTPGLSVPALCEACGPTRVDIKGNCIYHKGRTAAECFADYQAQEQKRRDKRNADV